MAMTRLTWLLLLIFHLARCQATSAPNLLGASIDPSSSAYQCNTSKCTISNNCQCASLSPPGGLKPADVPQFITITLDDAIQTYTIDAVKSLVGHRANPNGCPPKLTFFTSLNYTNFSLVTTWYSTGNEIADHTMTHVGNPPENEIAGNMIALNALAGIPYKDFIGFRAPFLNYTVETLQTLQKLNFTYDSSMTANSDGKRGPGVPTDRTWPYTLDYGSVHDCENAGICGPNGVRIAGLWEIPMMVIYDQSGNPSLMDPYLDHDTNTVLNMLKTTFSDLYSGNRVPMGLYLHPIHLAQNYPGLPSPDGYIKVLNQFLDWAMAQSNVWIVSNKQLLAWMKNPTPSSALDGFDPLHCTVPDAPAGICNGLNSSNLEVTCPFADYYWNTCYGCPEAEITPTNPNPPQAQGQQRFRLPTTCDTPWWDPIKGECTCNTTTCAYTDATRPVGANDTANGKGNASSSGTVGKSGAASWTTDLMMAAIVVIWASLWAQ